MQRLIIIVWFVIWGSSLPLQAAVEVTDLYQHRVQVSSQSASERTAALQEALQATLLKLTGDTSVMDHPAVQQALRDVRNLLVQYGYQQDEQLWLWAQFDRPQVDRLIQDAGSGIWSNVRPRLLMWLVVEDQDLSRKVMASDSEAIIVQQMQKAARLRGLPVQLPLLDLNDTMTVSVIDVWARFMDTIDFVSTRYSPDGVIIARVYQTDPSAGIEDKWMADWTLTLGELRWSGEVTAMDHSVLGAEVVSAVTEQLAQRYRIGSQSDVINRWQVTIENLTDLETTIAAEQLLQSLPAIINVQLLGYGNHTARFELTMQTDPARIRQAIDLSKQLQPLATQTNAEYRWINQQ
ncbi:DUF2066 domain-containing protein [Pseudidiomarina sp. 1APP75-32.1]|uniref:DUF2066 domain-containing protein n=1 Tax=Pseudidiomarina terrestris TaxID=2820060 RepID=A0AAW7QXA3_9GAMM|nr:MULTISPECIES: DUF2066 domain-containing protein [unclassified Pseudidiomarina]MDN7124092.1 DUF2066 domain-containing protein [Pseudidiomarina sp. 1APP75-32.1]MDN7127164.1 DUF2066 domain-containing protein [Pseudidiomarina sp. 1APR75-33.1]MDN7128349.1 DUF2066 domain-containing protein [Pseudidiomarina sp. 1APR75-15]MEA3586839.1 DUF2066 domain-containing protein [Pseudidiomarina sp. 1APP75-27a]